jgi:hypothetical protein
MGINIKKWMFAVPALALLLGACEKELPDNKSGKEVVVQVRLVGVAEGGEEDLTRSDSTKEPEMVSTSIGDGMLLEMQMARDTSALRATRTQLAATSYFRVVAFKHGTSTFISYGDFTINDGPVAGGLHVPTNDHYDFVCYSYNTNIPLDALNYNQDATMPTTEVIDVFQGTNDLLYKKIVDIEVADAAPVLEILLNRVMVRVKIIVDLSYNEWTITGISGDLTLESVGTGGTIRLTDGVVASNTGTPTFSSWTGSGYQWESSTELLVTPRASGTTVSIPIGAVARQGLTAVPASAATSTFTSALRSGFSYKLLVRLRIPIWARSNIYWDKTASELAFEPADGVTDYQGYQGLFFKWGSMVGISPVGDWSDNSTLVYEAGAATHTTYSSWNAILYSSGATVGNPNTSTLLGDICKHINSDYRLPKDGEFGTVLNPWNQQGWEKHNTINAVTTNKDDGTYDFIDNNNAYAKNTVMDVILPFSGLRMGTTSTTLGLIYSVGQSSAYWISSSSGMSTHGNCLALYIDYVFPSSNYIRNYAFPVRCVKN